MTLSDLCTDCGHPRFNHREHLTDAERVSLAIGEARGCLLEGCSCTVFGEPQASAPETPPAVTPGEARLVDADERQVWLILQLARAIGATVAMNWDEFPTGRTRGQSLTQMGCAALVRATAQLLAAGLQQLPDADARVDDALEVHVEMLRGAFAQARQELRDHATAAGAPQLEGRPPPPVMVPAPKRTM